MTESRMFIRAFLASPGDLSDERLAIRDCVDEINRTVAGRLGCHVELQGWEETIGGVGRPQELINKDADRCDLFLGMMHKRWGMPPSDFGIYTSGFEEEYERARSRNRDTGKPEIKLFFKHIDEDSLKDPGEQLSKVVDFKSAVVSAREILYKEFANINELELLVRGAITDYVFNQLGQEQLEQHLDTTKNTTSEGNDSSPAASDGSLSPISAEGYSFLQGFLEKAKEKDTYLGKL